MIEGQAMRAADPSLQNSGLAKLRTRVDMCRARRTELISRHYEEPRPFGRGDVVISFRFRVADPDTNPSVVHNQAGLRRFVRRKSGLARNDESGACGGAERIHVPSGEGMKSRVQTGAIGKSSGQGLIQLNMMTGESLGIFRNPEQSSGPRPPAEPSV